MLGQDEIIQIITYIVLILAIRGVFYTLVINN